MRPNQGEPESADTTPQLLNRLRMRQIALLLAIEEQGTLRAAAGALGLTQPAATKMLRELENALGLPLFDRVGRGLQLTAAGHCALGYFKGLRGTMASLNEELRQLRQGGVGKLRIGAIMAASPVHLAEALIALKQRWPQLDVEIDTDTSDRLLEHLDEGLLDLVIGRLPRRAEAGYVYRPLANESLSVIAATDHPLAGRRQLQFADLQAYPWILQSAGSPMRQVIEQEFLRRNTPLPRGLIETASILTTTNLIARTQMIAVIPQSVASLYERHGLLCTLAYRIRQQLAAYGSITRRDRPLHATARQFLALLHDEASGLSASAQS
ncbi:MAG: HTH-type transcriptional regulator GbpR [Paracidovorax wautersii]|uniref:HTH-type transcriptional regulator GbpR n=1 Tax=Paracidovorax wautersii TaxID=1177982 RepID=A0A7V8JQ09_9BURK|nr:MAG: HTH-type transcriptional regulator GbpR [Paracidovorax wautersii]